MDPASPYPYSGPAAWRQPIEAALRRVVDPELALTVLDVGLVYGVSVDERCVQVRLTMTSPACPVADVIIDDIENELAQVLPDELACQVKLVWEPAWTSDRMSERAKAFMGW